MYIKQLLFQGDFPFLERKILSQNIICSIFQSHNSIKMKNGPYILQSNLDGTCQK